MFTSREHSLIVNIGVVNLFSRGRWGTCFGNALHRAWPARSSTGQVGIARADSAQC